MAPRAASGQTKGQAKETKATRVGAASRLDDARARMYRDLIFESAEFIFGQKGFDGATMQEIAAEAGVSLKTVYSSFPGKVEIYNEIMAVRGREMSQAIVGARDAAMTPTEKIELGTRAFVAYLFEHSDWLRIHVQSRLSWAVRPKNEAVAKLWQDGVDSYAQIISEGIAAGEFYPDDAKETAVLLQAITKVQVSQALEANDLDVEKVSARLNERIRRLVCKTQTYGVQNAVPDAIQETG